MLYPIRDAIGRGLKVGKEVVWNQGRGFIEECRTYPS